MPFIMKKTYQYLNVAFILMTTVLYALLTYGVKGDSNLVFYGAGFLTMFIMTLLLIFIEYKLSIMNKFSVVIYSLVGIVLPPLILLSKYSYMAILIISIPVLIYNLSRQEKANYSFRVDNYYLINVVYLVNMILGVLLLLTKQPYYLVGLIFVALTVTIDFLILFKLFKAKSPTLNRRIYLSSIIIGLTFFLAFTGEVPISTTQSQSVLSINFIYPVLAIIFLSVSSRLNRSNLINLVNMTSIT